MVVKIKCPFEQSAMTPCIARDGELALVRPSPQSKPDPEPHPITARVLGLPQAEDEPVHPWGYCVGCRMELKALVAFLAANEPSAGAIRSANGYRDAVARYVEVKAAEA